MATVLLVLHLMLALGLIGVVLLQRSEGGGLGMGGGGGGGFMTGRGTANLLTRVTAGLAGLFFLTSIGLTLLAKQTAMKITIVGHPEKRGSDELAKRRAEAVKWYLVDQGIAADQISSENCCSSDAVATNPTCVRIAR